MSPQIALKDLLLQGIPEALGYTKNQLVGEADIPSMQKGDPEELQQQKRVQWAQERFHQKTSQATFLAKVQQAKEAKQMQ